MAPASPDPFRRAAQRHRRPRPLPRRRARRPLGRRTNTPATTGGCLVRARPAMSTRPECSLLPAGESLRTPRVLHSPVLADMSAVIGSSPLLPRDFANSRARERVPVRSIARRPYVGSQPPGRGHKSENHRAAKPPPPSHARLVAGGRGAEPRTVDPTSARDAWCRSDKAKDGGGGTRTLRAAGAGRDAAVSSVEFAEALGVFDKLAEIPRQFAAAERLLGRAGGVDRAGPLGNAGGRPRLVAATRWRGPARPFPRRPRAAPGTAYLGRCGRAAAR